MQIVTVKCRMNFVHIFDTEKGHLIFVYSNEVYFVWIHRVCNSFCVILRNQFNKVRAHLNARQKLPEVNQTPKWELKS